MSRSALLLILASITLTALAQVTLKVGMTGRAIQNSIMVGPGWSTIVQVLRSPIVMGGLALYGGSAILWLGVLSKVPVSRAYPFAALAVVLTTLAGRFLLGEPLGGVQIVGISLICIGVVLLGSV